MAAGDLRRYSGRGYQIDLLVENTVIVELKVAEKIPEVHKTQLLSYLKLSDRRGTPDQFQCRSSAGWDQADGK